MGWVGISVAIAGSFQGLLLLGMGAIGTAILDGSLAQQKIAGSYDSLSSTTSQSNQSVATSPDYVRIKNYKGKIILRGPSGIVISGYDSQFKNIIEAERHIDEIQSKS